MPKSKRAKVVHLSKVEKKGKEPAIRLYKAVQECADQYQYIFVFEVENMRNNYLKDVRTQFPDSRLFFGKTKLIAKALGHSVEEEHLPNLSQLTPQLRGDVGVLFSSQPPDEILGFFAEYVEMDFARAGTVAPRTFVVPEGVVYSRAGEERIEDDTPLPHSLEPTLRRWGMPTRLVKGKVVLDDPYELCKEGKELNSHQTSLLKLFGVAMAEFRVKVKTYYNSATQEVTNVEPTNG